MEHKEFRKKYLSKDEIDCLESISEYQEVEKSPRIKLGHKIENSYWGYEYIEGVRNGY